MTATTYGRGGFKSVRDVNEAIRAARTFKVYARPTAPDGLPIDDKLRIWEARTKAGTFQVRTASGWHRCDIDTVICL